MGGGIQILITVSLVDYVVEVNLSPYNVVDCKAVNRYLLLQFKLRDRIDAGEIN